MLQATTSKILEIMKSKMAKRKLKKKNLQVLWMIWMKAVKREDLVI